MVIAQILAFLLVTSPDPEGIQIIPASFSSEDIAVYGLETIDSTSKLIDFKGQKIVAHFTKSLLVPKLSQFPHLYFIEAAEFKPERKLEELDLKSIFEKEKAICGLVLSVMQEIFLPPYVLAASSLKILDISEEEVSWGAPEKLGLKKLVLRLEENSRIESLECLSKESLTVDEVEKSFPDLFRTLKLKEIVEEGGQSLKPKALPSDASTVSSGSFVLDTDPDFSEFGRFGILANDENSLRRYFQETHWSTARGFDHWGYFEGAETSIGEKGKLRVFIRRYDSPFRRYNDPFCR